MMKFLRRYKDLKINGLTARWHDKNSHHHSIDEFRSYAREVIKHVEKGGFALEIAPGPGIWQSNSQNQNFLKNLTQKKSERVFTSIFTNRLNANNF